MAKDPKIYKEIKELRERVSYAEYVLDKDTVYEKNKDLLGSFPECEVKRLIFEQVLLTAESADKDGTKYPFYADEIDWLFSITGEKTRKAMLCLLFWKKQNPHESGWIKYDVDKIFSPLFSDVEIDEMDRRKTVLNRCYENGLDMRVVGSKNPIVCYSLPEFEQDELYQEVSVEDLPIFWESLRRD